MIRRFAFLAATMFASLFVISGGAHAQIYFSGLGTSNDISSPNSVMDVAAGSAADDGAAVIMTLGAFTKNVNAAWVAGSGNGCLDANSGSSLAASAWYEIYLTAKASGTTDVVCSSSGRGQVNLPSGYSYKRAIGILETDASAHIMPFVQSGFSWQIGSPALVINETNLAAPKYETLSNQPFGFQVSLSCTGSGTSWWVSNNAPFTGTPNGPGMFSTNIGGNSALVSALGSPNTLQCYREGFSGSL